MTRLPALGPRGEGWVVGQVLIAAAVIRAAAQPPAWHGAARLVTGAFGAALLVLGGPLGLCGARDLRSSISPLPRPRPDGRLVEDGIYAHVRHPIYGGQVVMAAGLALLRASPRALALVPLFAAFMRLKARREEAFLTSRYPGYRAYAARTRGFIPRAW